MGMESNRNQITTAHSHTHYQAPQVNAKTQPWQRVCLSQLSTEPTEKRTDEEEALCPNSLYV